MPARRVTLRRRQKDRGHSAKFSLELSGPRAKIQSSLRSSCKTRKALSTIFLKTVYSSLGKFIIFRLISLLKFYDIVVSHMERTTVSRYSSLIRSLRQTVSLTRRDTIRSSDWIKQIKKVSIGHV